MQRVARVCSTGGGRLLEGEDEPADREVEGGRECGTWRRPTRCVIRYARREAKRQHPIMASDPSHLCTHDSHVSTPFFCVPLAGGWEFATYTISLSNLRMMCIMASAFNSITV